MLIQNLEEDKKNHCNEPLCVQLSSFIIVYLFWFLYIFSVTLRESLSHQINRQIIIIKQIDDFNVGFFLYKKNLKQIETSLSFYI